MKPYELPCYHWPISLKNELYFQSFSSEELKCKYGWNHFFSWCGELQKVLILITHFSRNGLLHLALCEWAGPSQPCSLQQDLPLKTSSLAPHWFFNVWGWTWISILITNVWPWTFLGLWQHLIRATLMQVVCH